MLSIWATSECYSLSCDLLPLRYFQFLMLFLIFFVTPYVLMCQRGTAKQVHVLFEKEHMYDNGFLKMNFEANCAQVTLEGAKWKLKRRNISMKMCIKEANFQRTKSWTAFRDFLLAIPLHVLNPSCITRPFLYVTWKLALLLLAQSPRNYM